MFSEQQNSQNKPVPCPYSGPPPSHTNRLVLVKNGKICRKRGKGAAFPALKLSATINISVELHGRHYIASLERVQGGPLGEILLRAVRTRLGRTGQNKTEQQNSAVLVLVLGGKSQNSATQVTGKAAAHFPSPSCQCKCPGALYQVALCSFPARSQPQAPPSPPSPLPPLAAGRARRRRLSLRT